VVGHAQHRDAFGDSFAFARRARLVVVQRTTVTKASGSFLPVITWAASSAWS
jgi:hypothetical protein